MTFTPKNFVDGVGPVVPAAWLNQLDQLANNALQSAITVPALQAILGVPSFASPLPISTGGTGQANAASALAALGGTTLGAVEAAINLFYLGSLLYPRTAAEISAGIVPTNIWYPELDLRRYGFTGLGIVSDYPAINSAILVAQRYTAATILFPPNSNVLCNTGLVWDASVVTIDLNGSVLNFSNLLTGSALAPFNSNADVNQQPTYSIAHGFRNGVCIGPGGTTPVAWLVLNDVAHTPNNIASMLFQNLGVREFQQDVVLTNGAFCAAFENIVFSRATTPLSTAYSIIQNSASNNGERNSFTNCFWFNKPFGLSCLSANSDIFFINCSLDGMTTVCATSAGSNIFFTNCHIESGVDTANWFFVSGPNGGINLNGCEIILGLPKSAFPMFYSDSTCTNGGIFIADCTLGFGAVYTASFGAAYGSVLIGGTGNARVRNLVQQHNSSKPGISSALNVLAYPGFESASYTVEWTLVAGAVRSNVAAHTGTWSLSLPASAGVNPSGTAITPCQPGQYAQGSLWYQAATIAAQGATLQGVVSYLDKGGNTLSSGAFFTITANAAAFTNVPFSSANPAPFGTVSAAVSVTCFGAAALTTAYVDDVLFNVV